MTDTKKVKISVDAVGHGTLLVNGNDLSRAVRGVQFFIRHGEPNRIFLELAPGAAEIDMDGLMSIMSDEGRALEMVDPEEVDRLALERMGMGFDTEETSLTAVIISILKEMVNGPRS